MAEVRTGTETEEKSVFLYDTWAALGDSFDDEPPQSPFSYGHDATQTSLFTSSQTSSIQITKSRQTNNLSSANPVEEGSEVIPDSFEETSGSRMDDFSLGGAETVLGIAEIDQEVEPGEADVSQKAHMTIEASATSLENSSPNDGWDFLSLDVDDHGGSVLDVPADEMIVTKADSKIGATQEAPPWARTRTTQGTWFKSPFLQLHQEIVDFCNFVAPTEEEISLRADAVQRIREVVQEIWPSCEVKVFGSFATGLFLPTSDCDVVILESGCQVPQDGLKAIAKALTRKSLVKNLQVIGKARVPIVKFVETESNISFDISFDVANGPQAADFIKAAMDNLPPLKPLCLVLKIFLQQRELNEVYTGGIGSYALIVMLLTHLQMHPSRRNPNHRGKTGPLESNLGILLIDFFDFYGRALNVREVGISCRKGGRFYQKVSRGFHDSNRAYLLSVEDPQSPDNDICKNSYNMTKVRSAFVLAHRLLTKMEVEDVPAHVGLLGRIVRVDSELSRRKSVVPKLLTNGTSTIKLVEMSHVSGISFSAGESEVHESRIRGRWEDLKDEVFPRGGEPHLTQKSLRKRKHAKDSGEQGQGESSSHNYYPQHKRTRNAFVVEHGVSSSVEGHLSRHGIDLVGMKGVNSDLSKSLDHDYVREQPRAIETGTSSGKISKHLRTPESTMSRHGKDLAGLKGSGSNPHDQEHRRERPQSNETSNGKISKVQRATKRGMGWQVDNVDPVTTRQTPEAKKSRHESQNGHDKDEPHEEGEIVMDDPRDGVDDVERAGDEVVSGAGNGHNKHKRWFNEGRLRKSTEGLERRAWLPGEDSGRSTKRVVISTPAHKKIKYL